jgi:hypothetical protein
VARATGFDPMSGRSGGVACPPPALAQAQREAAQDEKLASLTTLAAGAAHGLATPLGTIAIAATGRA